MIAALLALGRGAFSLLAVMTGVFVLIHLAPGGAAAALAGDFATAETQAALRESFGLDRPLLGQYLTFLGQFAQGDWGYSYHFRRPVSAVIAERLPATIALMVPALLIATAAGTWLGVRVLPGRFGPAVRAGAIAIHALPIFWLGQVLMLVFGLELGWFPLSGMHGAREEVTGLRAVVDVAAHAALPVLALSLHQTAFFLMVVGAKASVELEQEYVHAARARGLTPFAIRWGHVLRNVLPQLTGAVLGRIGVCCTGAVLVETVFAWPGIGRLLATALQSRDHPLLLGVLTVIAALTISASVLTDWIVRAIDPRIREATQ